MSFDTKDTTEAGVTISRVTKPERIIFTRNPTVEEGRKLSVSVEFRVGLEGIQTGGDERYARSLDQAEIDALPAAFVAELGNIIDTAKAKL